jgi:hypothetical protein
MKTNCIATRLVLLAVFIGFACDAESNETTCDPGEVRICPCVEMDDGYQICVEDGSKWDRCICADKVDTGSEVPINSDEDTLTDEDTDFNTNTEGVNTDTEGVNTNTDGDAASDADASTNPEQGDVRIRFCNDLTLQGGGSVEFTLVVGEGQKVATLTADSLKCDPPEGSDCASLEKGTEVPLVLYEDGVREVAKLTFSEFTEGTEIVFFTSLDRGVVTLNYHTLEAPHTCDNFNVPWW